MDADPRYRGFSGAAGRRRMVEGGRQPEGAGFSDHPPPSPATGRVKKMAAVIERGAGSPCVSGDQPLDPLHFLGFQVEVEDLEILPHVVGVGRPRQRHHAHLEREPEDDLVDGPAVPLGDPIQLGSGRRDAVGGQQRKALIAIPFSLQNPRIPRSQPRSA